MFKGDPLSEPILRQKFKSTSYSDIQGQETYPGKEEISEPLDSATLKLFKIMLCLLSLFRP